MLRFLRPNAFRDRIAPASESAPEGASFPARGRLALTAGFIIAASGAILIGPNLGTVLAGSDDHAAFWRAENARKATQRQAAAPAVRQPARAVKAVSTPSNFPRVDGNTQKARDTDRMQILVDELKDEEGKLANLRQAFNNGQPARRGDETNEDTYRERVANLRDDLNRTEKNIEALKREIGKLK